jgi:hypothetical protein
LDKNNERPDWMTDLKHNDSHDKKMHVKEIYVIFIHFFDSGILLIIDLNKKKGGKKGGWVNFICEFYS